MKLKFLGHHCFLISYQGKNILLDPFYNFQREQSGFEIKSQEIDYVLITHAHQDHTADVSEVLENYPEVKIIAQPEICGYFKAKNGIDLNIGGGTRIGDLEIFMTSAQHTSSFGDGAYGGEPSGFVLRFEGKVIYFSGDTGVDFNMSLIQPLYGKIDLAVLPIGGHYTMDSHQASYAAKELIKTSRVMACHFDTFPPIEIDKEKAQKDFQSKGIELILPKIGEEFSL